MPDADAIAEAITEYAKRHGLEEKLTAKDKPQTQRQRRSSSSYGYDQLQSIIVALEGRIVRQGGAENESAAPPPQEVFIYSDMGMLMFDYSESSAVRCQDNVVFQCPACDELSALCAAHLTCLWGK